MIVEVHPADPQKVVTWEEGANGEKVGKPVACDNIFGEFDDYLTPAQRKAREAEPFYLVDLSELASAGPGVR